MIEVCCLSTIVVLTIVSSFINVPLQINIVGFSLSIIIAGCYRSVDELIAEFKKIHVNKRSGEGGEGVETMTKEDVQQFPLYAGGMLCGMYGMIKYFGKEIVNPLLLAYMGFAGGESVKPILSGLTGGASDKYQENKLFHLKLDWAGIDLDVTVLDIFCLIISYSLVAIYMITKYWVYNNLLAIGMCVNAIQMIFLGNFKNGFMLLVFLFFYDIFFVFGTDVMLTVAKSIDAPIKLLFPTDWNAVNEETGLLEPKYSLLGLGDIVIPGIFIALCLRFDVIKTLDSKKINTIMDKGDPSDALKLFHKAAATASTPYFFGCLIGYLIAIVTTIAIMFIFEHGQPALLYLVPGCLLSVLINALMRGELSLMWEFSEEKFTNDKKPEEEEKKAGGKRKVVYEAKKTQ